MEFLINNLRMKSFFKAAVVIAVVSCVISLILTLGKPDFYGEVEVVSVSQTFGSNETNLVVKDLLTSGEVNVSGNFRNEFSEGDVASLYVDANLSWLWPGYASETEFMWARLVYWFGLSFIILLWCLFFALVINRLIKTLIVLVRAKFKTARRRIVKCYSPKKDSERRFYYVEGLSLDDQVMITELEVGENKVELTVEHKKWHPVRRVCNHELKCCDEPEEGMHVLALKFGPVWMFSYDNVSLLEQIESFRKYLITMLLADLFLLIAGLWLFFFVIF